MEVKKKWRRFDHSVFLASLALLGKRCRAKRQLAARGRAEPGVYGQERRQSHRVLTSSAGREEGPSFDRVFSIFWGFFFLL